MAVRGVLAALVVVASACALCVQANNAANDNLDIASELESFAEKARQRDQDFLQYTRLLNDSLHADLRGIDKSLADTEAAIAQRQHQLHTLRLQLGASEQSMDDQNHLDIHSGANLIVECASAKSIHSNHVASTSQIMKLAQATSAFVDALQQSLGSNEHQRNCLATVQATLHSLDSQSKAIVFQESAGFNKTAQHCIQSQRRLATDAQWTTSNEIPVMEDVVALHNEMRTLSDILDELAERKRELEGSKEAKLRRLQTLDNEVAEHGHMAAQQVELLSRLTKLAAGLAM